MKHISHSQPITVWRRGDRSTLAKLLKRGMWRLRNSGVSAYRPNRPRRCQPQPGYGGFGKRLRGAPEGSPFAPSQLLISGVVEATRYYCSACGATWPTLMPVIIGRLLFSRLERGPQAWFLTTLYLRSRAPAGRASTWVSHSCSA